MSTPCVVLLENFITLYAPLYRERASPYGDALSSLLLLLIQRKDMCTQNYSVPFIFSIARAAASRPPRPNASPSESARAKTTPVKRTSTRP